MCMHDGLDEECPGRNCPCPCDSCVLGDGSDDDDEEDMHDYIARRIGLEVGESKQVEFQGRTWTMTRKQ